MSAPALADGVSDIKNFHQVGTHLYRGARPGPEGLRAISKLGVKTVLNLDNDKTMSAQEMQMAKSLGMNYVSVPMSGFWRPRDNQVLIALTVIASPGNWPVYVHCKNGDGPTGVVIGLYRVFTEKWTQTQAWAEMNQLGFRPIMIFLRDYFQDTARRTNFWPRSYQ